MFPDIGHFQQIRIEARVLEHLAKGGFVQAGGAGGHHDPVEVMFRDVFLDALLSGFGAGIGDIAGDHDAVKARGRLGNLQAVHRPSDIQPAMADIDTNAGGRVLDVVYLLFPWSYRLSSVEVVSGLVT